MRGFYIIAFLLFICVCALDFAFLKMYEKVVGLPAFVVAVTAVATPLFVVSLILKADELNRSLQYYKKYRG